MKTILSKDFRAYLMGFSILWIIAFHFCYYSALLGNPILDFFFGKGYLGVDIFMFLSSYGLCHSFEANSTLEFYKRRVKRIYPMYFLFLIVLLSLFGKYYEDSAAFLFFMQISGLASFRQVDLEWFIPALLLLYFIFPILFKACKAIYKRNPYWFIPITFVLCVAGEPLTNVMMSGLAYRICIFLLGIITYLALKDSNERFLFIQYTACVIFVFMFRFSDHITGSMLVPMVLLGLAFSKIKGFPLAGPVSFVGKHSLEVYLAQSLALNQYFLRSDDLFIKKTIIAFVIIVVVAVCLSLFQNLFDRITSRR